MIEIELELKLKEVNKDREAMNELMKMRAFESLNIKRDLTDYMEFKGYDSIVISRVRAMDSLTDLARIKDDIEDIKILSRLIDLMQKIESMHSYRERLVKLTATKMELQDAIQEHNEFGKTVDNLVVSLLGLEE